MFLNNIKQKIIFDYQIYFFDFFFRKHKTVLIIIYNDKYIHLMI